MSTTFVWDVCERVHFVDRYVMNRFLVVHNTINVDTTKLNEILFRFSDSVV